MAQGAAFIFFSAVIPIEVIYAKETLGAGDSGYGIMLGELGHRHGRRQPRLRRGAAGAPPLPAALQHPGGRRRLPRLAAAPTLAIACAASAVGGAGNGVQWVAAISAVQELTAANMQARVMSVLESIGAAMPGIGYVMGGVIAASQDPRAAFLVAGLGVIAIAIVAIPLLGTNWLEREEKPGSGEDFDAAEEIMVELIPAERHSLARSSTEPA